MKQKKDDEAYGLLNKLYNFGPSVCIAPILMNYYVTLLKTERGDESEKVREELTNTIKNEINSTARECQLLGDKFRKDKEHHKALLFYQIAAESICLHHIETIERMVGDHEARHRSLLQQVQLMIRRLGEEEASKTEVYGGALNNLGTSYLYLRQPDDAIEAFCKAIEAKMRAEDYDTEAEKVADVEMSVPALSMAEEMKTEMEPTLLED
ncbi:unnamed protein product [Clavelina lepadiformis]|uniref:Uncharacterized protein n=1 Tax=Clavelina lepadiformis TaxID=159417 RepID=A0ABP0FQA4_CLALP